MLEKISYCNKSIEFLEQVQQNTLIHQRIAFIITINNLQMRHELESILIENLLPKSTVVLDRTVSQFI